MSKNIFRTKSINQLLSETKQDGGMNRVLGTFGLTMLGIGCIVGTGIFVLTGIAAANYSGPALVISSSSPHWPAAVLHFAILNSPP